MNVNEDFENFSKSITSIKALTIFAVVIAHIDPNFILQTNIGPDIYVFLSGMLLTIGMLRNSERIHSWKQWYKRRIIKIYPTLILSTCFILFFQYIRKKTVYAIYLIFIHISGFQSIPGNPDFYQIDGPHWFITLILTCYFLYPLFYALIKKNFKLNAFLGFFIYSIFILFVIFFHIVLQSEIKGFILGYFEFYCGTLLGFWIEQNESSNLKILQENKNGALFFIFLVVLITLYSIYLFVVLNSEDHRISLYYYNQRLMVFQPPITIFLTVFLIYFLTKKTKINKILKLPGNESYEMIMTHTGMMILILNITPNIFWFLDYNMLFILSVSLIFIGSIVLAYPFYYVANWLKNKEKSHIIILTISLSLIIYTIMAYFIPIFNLFYLSDFNSIVLYISILLILIIIICFRFFKKFL